MNTITRIFGFSKPSNVCVDAEFERRNLALSDFRGDIVQDSNDDYHVHGHYMTRSDNAETAIKKMLIAFNEMGL
jgi:hypothetical protein